MVAGGRSFLRRFLPIAALFFPLAAAAPALAGKNLQAFKTPRFESLRSDRINLRVGPGLNYPILWVLTRKGLPVEILRNFDDWRKIRDFEGDKGWVQENMVAPQRTVVVMGKVRALRARPNAPSRLVARAEPGVIASLLGCRGAWCQIEVSGITGWVERNEVWGAPAPASAQ